MHELVVAAETVRAVHNCNLCDTQSEGRNREGGEDEGEGDGGWEGQRVTLLYTAAEDPPVKCDLCMRLQSV